MAHWRTLVTMATVIVVMNTFHVFAQETEDHYPRTLDWNSDGTKLAVGYLSGELEIMDFSTNQTTTQDYGDFITSVDWHPTDPNVLAFADVYGRLRILDIETNNFLLDTQIGDLIYEITWHPQGDFIAVSIHEPSITSFEYYAIVIDASNGVRTYQASSSEISLSQIAWSPDGNRLAIGGADALILIRDIFGSMSPIVLRGHTDDVSDLEWSPDGSKMISSGDNTLRIWNVSDGENIATSTFELGAGSLDLSSTGLIALIVGGQDIYLIDAATVEILHALDNSEYIHALTWQPNREQLVYALGCNSNENCGIMFLDVENFLSTATPTP